jgi:hypothetical protein
LQKSAKAVHPSPPEAKKKENRPQMYADGCHLPTRKTKSSACVYANPSSKTTVVLFGDSHAVIEDSPRVGKDIPECVSHSLDDLPECAFPRSKAMAQPRFNARAASEVERASLIDATPMICPGKMCPAVIGDVLVYRNGSHLTATYVLTLTPWLAEHLPEPAGS